MTADLAAAARVAGHYLLTVALMGPPVVLLGLAVRFLLPRLPLRTLAQEMVVILVLVALLGAPGVLLPFLAEGSRFEPELRSVFLASLAFLLCAPVHLGLGLRLLSARPLRPWLFLLAYLLFPLAIVLAPAALGVKVGDLREDQEERLARAVHRGSGRRALARRRWSR